MKIGKRDLFLLGVCFTLIALPLGAGGQRNRDVGTSASSGGGGGGVL
jgi:hypothetical protein